MQCVFILTVIGASTAVKMRGPEPPTGPPLPPSRPPPGVWRDAEGSGYHSLESLPELAPALNVVDVDEAMAHLEQEPLPPGQSDIQQAPQPLPPASNGLDTIRYHPHLHNTMLPMSQLQDAQGGSQASSLPDVPPIVINNESNAVPSATAATPPPGLVMPTHPDDVLAGTLAEVTYCLEQLAIVKTGISMQERHARELKEWLHVRLRAARGWRREILSQALSPEALARSSYGQGASASSSSAGQSGVTQGAQEEEETSAAEEGRSRSRSPRVPA